jgi:hypothetical protein
MGQMLRVMADSKMRSRVVSVQRYEAADPVNPPQPVCQRLYLPRPCPTAVGVEHHRIWVDSEHDLPHLHLVVHFAGAAPRAELSVVIPRDRLWFR